jgi:6-phosphogluconolactonase
MKNIYVFKDIDELALAAAKLFRDKIKETPDGTPINVALSGGSTPKRIFDVISSQKNESAKWSRVRFFWVDERCVSPEDEQSNFKMTRIHFFEKLEIPEDQIFRIVGEADPVSEAVRYGKLISEMLPVRDGFPRFDLIILGLGVDGHTASIFPGNSALFQSHHICEAVVQPQTGQQRITLTGGVINNADNIVFMVTGSDKAEIIAKIVKEGAASEWPASLVKPVMGKIKWFLDVEAAKMINQP